MRNNRESKRLLELAVNCMYSARPNEALNAAALYTRAPNDLDLYLYIQIFCHINLEKLQEAEQIFSQFTKTKFNKQAYFLSLSLLLWAQGKHLKAKRISNALLDKYTECIHTLYLNLKIHLSISDFDTAIKLCDKIILTKPEFPDPYLIRGQLCLKTQPKKAKKDLLRALELSDDPNRFGPTLLQLFYSQSEYEAAIEIFEKIEVQNTTTNVILVAVKTYIALARFSEAKITARKLLKSFSKNFELDSEAFILIAQLKLVNEVTNKSNQYLELYKNSWHAHLVMGIVFENIGYYDQAIKQYEIALNLDPNSFEAHFGLANALKSNQEYPRALKHYQSALIIKPSSKEAHNNLGDLHKILYRNKDALQNFRRALKLDPNYADALSNTANITLERGKICAAYRLYKKSIQENPNHIPSSENFLDLSLQTYNLKDFSKYSNGVVQTPKITTLKKIFGLLTNTKPGQQLASDPTYNLNYSKEDLVFISAYQLLCDKLLEILPAKFTSNQNIYHIGNSHCLSTVNASVKIRGHQYNIEQRLIVGLKAFHLRRDASSRYKSLLNYSLRSIPRNSKVIFSIGEIDCRPDEGLLPAAKKRNLPLTQLINETVSVFLEHILNENKKYGHEIYFVNVHAPTGSEKILSDQARSKVICNFNSKLYKLCQKFNFGFIDAYSFTANKKGFARSDLYLDNVHLPPNLITKVIEFYLNKSP